jgi:hypothetical protein
MITYEVTAKVGSHLAGEYEQYMTELHIPDVLATGAFQEAAFLMTNDGLYRTTYVAENSEKLEFYLNEHSTRLRKDLLNRFPEGIELSRNEWETIRTWKC